MRQDSVIPPESFEEILAWLSPDRETAAAIYLQLRLDLTKIFTWSKNSDPEGLTDEVIDRVSRKVHDLKERYEGDPRHFFYAVARNLIKEATRKTKTYVSLEHIDLMASPLTDAEGDTKYMREECLSECLEKLSNEKRQLILGYYEKQAKIDHRSAMAEQMGTSVETLRVRAFRIRGQLEECVLKCLKRKEPNQ